MDRPALKRFPKQEQPSQPSARQSQTRAEHRQEMMKMHKQQMAAMRADVEEMKSSLVQISQCRQGQRSRRESTLAGERGHVGNDALAHGLDAKAHGVHARHDGRRHGRPAASGNQT